MPGHNELNKIADGRRMNTLTKSATATLTAQEVLYHGVIIGATADGAVTLTVPAASGGFEGHSFLVANNGGNDLKVVVAAGYGGVGGGGDTITLARGDMAMLYCDGTYWYSLHHTTPAAA